MSKVVIVVEGWRFIPHSYALTTQHLCLELLKRDDVTLFHRDVPFFDPAWRCVLGSMPPEDEKKLREIPPPPEGAAPDVVLRGGFPPDFGPSRARRTFVWATTECGVAGLDIIPDAGLFKRAMSQPGFEMITPSEYSRYGFVRSGAPRSRVHVVFLGADPATCRPLVGEEKEAARRRFGIKAGFAFLNVGSLLYNKGTDVLFAAFAGVVSRHPSVSLVLKGLNSLYQSETRLRQLSAMLPRQVRDAAASRTVYIGDTLSEEGLGALYGAADAYVCPYRAEGFNMPALEAITAGLPLIATKGGPTDEFTTGEFSLRVPSKKVLLKEGFMLEPNVEQLTVTMNRIVTDEAFRAAARTAGPAHVAAGLTWKHTCDRFMDIVHGRSGASSV